MERILAGFERSTLDGLSALSVVKVRPRTPGERACTARELATGGDRIATGGAARIWRRGVLVGLHAMWPDGMSSHRRAGWSRCGRPRPAWSAIVRSPEEPWLRYRKWHSPGAGVRIELLRASCGRGRGRGTPTSRRVSGSARVHSVLARRGAPATAHASGSPPSFGASAPGRTAPRCCRASPGRTGGRASSSSRRPTSTVASWRELPTGSS